MLRRRLVTALLVAVTTSTLLAPSVDAAPTVKKVKPLRILVTNDDGVHAEGLDLLVEALRAEPKVKVTVVAPKDNKTGAGDSTSPVPPAAEPTETLSGYPAVMVDGFPADSVRHALDELGLAPHLVMSGINHGQNIGQNAADSSGTIGAAKEAVRHGVPALAVSQSIANPFPFEMSIELAIDWLREHRKELAKAKGRGATEVVNLNVPSCPSGEVRGLVETPLAPAERYVGEFVLDVPYLECDSTLEDPADDADALNNGFAVLTEISPD